jgi:hypothetical protein
VGAKCCVQIAKGYSILNTERNAKVGYCALENDGCEGVNNVTSRAINVLDSSSRGESPGVLFIGATRGSGNNVRTVPQTALFTPSAKSLGYYSHFTPLTTLHLAYYMATHAPSGQASIRHAAWISGPSRPPLLSLGRLFDDGLHLHEHLRPPL